MTEATTFPTGLSVEQARERVVEICSARVLPPERIALISALGRTFAGEATAPFDIPGFTNSAMDGFAVRGSDLPDSGDKEFQLVGEILAGGAPPPKVRADCCVRIMTGAPLPRGADTVVMKENTQSYGDRVIVSSGTPAGANVRPAGEDYRSGEVGVVRGEQLTPARLGVLASFGMAQIDVARRPRVVLLTTGDELVEPGKPLGFGQIHDSNRLSLGGLIEQHGGVLLRHERVRDDPPSLRDALSRAGAEADLIVSSGGVSAGDADFLPGLIGEIGKVHFWKVRIKPGMPFLFGEVGGALAFALPGNPVSGIAIFLTLLKPGLAALAGANGQTTVLRARLALPIVKRHARAEFQRARLASDAQAQLWATPQTRQGSGMLRGVAEADALIVLPEGAHVFSAGDVVDVLALPGWPR
jgi:molybdopterin molybdotransferase